MKDPSEKIPFWPANLPWYSKNHIAPTSAWSFKVFKLGFLAVIQHGRIWDLGCLADRWS